jgi:hypothetical protein
MSFKKSPFVLLLIVFSLILAAYSQQTAQALADSTAVQEKPLETDKPTVPMDSTDIYTGSVYLPIIPGGGQTTAGGYTVVDTGQTNCYDNQNTTACPQPGGSFYGQDAQYAGVQPSYVDNGDGTVTDLNTGLMWQKTPDLDNKVTYAEAVAGADTFSLAGYDDWRLPTIKELYSLIDFNGSSIAQRPYIDTDYFDFRFGDESAGERLIDAQYWSSTEYIGTVFGGQAAVFGVNFADGRIKGYGLTGPGGSSMTQFVRYVRGNPEYGLNDFVDNGDPSAGSGQAGTVTDLATGLMWQQTDSGIPMDWESALGYCENLEYAGYDDWRLPNAKELQSIVDYTQAPDAQNPAQQGPAIDPIFDVTETESWFWTSTTLLESPPNLGSGSQAVYVAFGQAFGVFNDPQGNNTLINVHGAGAQRSDPKSGDPADWEDGFGPQNDQIRIYNYARCVLNGAQFVEVTGSGSYEAGVQPAAGSQLPGGGEPPTGGQPPRGDQPPGGGQPPTGGQFPGRNQPPSGEGVLAGGQPPAQAISACSGLSENAACKFTSPRGSVNGTCLLVRSQLACVPQGARLEDHHRKFAGHPIGPFLP